MSSAPFISWIGHGAASLAQPGMFSGAKAWVFAIDADVGATQSLVDALLNPAGNGEVRYEAFVPVSMLTFLDVAKSTSLVDALGWVPGRECAIWVPLIERKPGSILGARLVFWSPYIFINYTIGMLTGREVWGWPKVGARIGVASDTPGNHEFFCTTAIVRTFGPTTQGEDALLYRVLQEQAGPNPPPPWKSAAEAVSGLLASLFGGIAGNLLSALQLQPAAPCIQLKQFRSAANADEACFQAIVESPVALTSFKAGGLLTGTYSVEITTCDSHRIVSDLLGRAPDPETTTLPVRAAAWLAGDFKALPGRDIVVRA